METARIAALLGSFLDRTLPEVPLQQISMYVDLLMRWNARINLTAVREREHIVTRHFGESLFLARHLFPLKGTASSVRVLDIGSGAGFPGLPLKIWSPAIHLTLIESNHKKAAFLREVARELRFTDVDVIADRAEVIRARPNFPVAEVVTLRAVERFETILPLAASFMAPGGRLALLIGSSQIAALSSLLGSELRWQPPVAIPGSESRVLCIGSN